MAINRQLAFIFGVYIFAPATIFLAAVYPWGNAALQKMLKNDHKLYFYSWIVFIVTHVILFAPIISVWVFIDNAAP